MIYSQEIRKAADEEGMTPQQYIEYQEMQREYTDLKKKWEEMRHDSGRENS